MASSEQPFKERLVHVLPKRKRARATDVSHMCNFKLPSSYILKSNKEQAEDKDILVIYFI